MLDGEIVIADRNGAGLDFDALLQRIHPAESRVKRLCAETPAAFVAFDALAEGDVDPIGNEPILSRGEVVGRLTSGGFGFHVGHAIALGYIRSDVASGSSGLEIEILGERRAARILEQAPFDPDGKRLRM